MLINIAGGQCHNSSHVATGNISVAAYYTFVAANLCLRLQATLSFTVTVAQIGDSFFVGKSIYFAATKLHRVFTRLNYSLREKEPT